jgi:hypothetical protein
MDTTHDTVYLTQKQLDDLVELVKIKTSTVKAEVASDFRPVGRVEYEKRKYKEISVSYGSQTIEIL